MLEEKVVITHDNLAKFNMNGIAQETMDRCPDLMDKEANAWSTIVRYLLKNVPEFRHLSELRKKVNLEQRTPWLPVLQVSMLTQI